jgi:hypothetical protein
MRSILRAVKIEHLSAALRSLVEFARVELHATRVVDLSLEKSRNVRVHTLQTDHVFSHEYFWLKIIKNLNILYNYQLF